MKQRTIDLLHHCTITGVSDRAFNWLTLCEKYNEKELVTKLHELYRKGYIDEGKHIRGAWLTPKGMQAILLNLAESQNRVENMTTIIDSSVGKFLKKVEEIVWESDEDGI